MRPVDQATTNEEETYGKFIIPRPVSGASPGSFTVIKEVGVNAFPFVTVKLRTTAPLLLGPLLLLPTMEEQRHREQQQRCPHAAEAAVALAVLFAAGAVGSTSKGSKTMPALSSFTSAAALATHRQQLPQEEEQQQDVKSSQSSNGGQVEGTSHAPPPPCQQQEEARRQKSGSGLQQAPYLTSTTDATIDIITTHCSSRRSTSQQASRRQRHDEKHGESSQNHQEQYYDDVSGSGSNDTADSDENNHNHCRREGGDTTTTSTTTNKETKTGEQSKPSLSSSLTTVPLLTVPSRSAPESARTTIMQGQVETTTATTDGNSSSSSIINNNSEQGPPRQHQLLQQQQQPKKKKPKQAITTASSNYHSRNNIDILSVAGGDTIDTSSRLLNTNMNMSNSTIDSTTTTTSTTATAVNAPPPTTTTTTCSGVGGGAGIIDTNSMLSLSSIGFGIDSSPSAALGDATEASLRAVRDAMDRSSLRVPFLAYHHNNKMGGGGAAGTGQPSSQEQHSHRPRPDALQIKMVLGVPARQDGTGEPMRVDVDRLSSLLHTSSACVPIRIVVGGLFIPSEHQGSPSICTAVASITLQSQWPVYVATSGAGAIDVAGPRHVAPSPVNHNSQEPQSVPCHCSNGAAAMSAATAYGSPPSLTAAIPSLSPTQMMKSTTESSTPPPTIVVGGGPSALRRDFRRSNSIEMLAMVAGEAETIRSAAVTEAAADSGGATVAAISMATNLKPPAALLPPSLLSTSTLEGIMKTKSQNEATQALQYLWHQQQQKERERPSLLEKDVSLLMTSQNPPSPSRHPLSSNTEVVKNVLVNAATSNGSDGESYRKMPPGQTNKKNPRLFAQHNYTDHSREEARSDEMHLYPVIRSTDGKEKSSPNNPFPLKLHETLAQIEHDGFGDIIGWLPHGR